jgi:predicted O-methyltransferase YrrM
MKIGPVAENEPERQALDTFAVPIPMVETLGIVKVRVLMAAVKLGLFEAIGADRLTADEVASRSQTHPEATKRLLDALVSAEYLRRDGRTYELAPVTRRWLVSDSPLSVQDYVRMQYLVWRWLERCEQYVKSGEPFIIHPEMTDEEWGIYQRSMRALAGLQAEEVAALIPVPAGARTMLDVGGAHGYNAVVLCRRYPGLTAVVLDLPKAVRHAAPILEQEGVGDRVVHRAGNALTEELGAAQWDVILMANVIQNFDEGSNRELFQRAARSLRPGGVLVVQESFRRSTPENADQTAILLDFLFAMTSASNTWSEEEIAGWQREAGLVPDEPVYFAGSSDYGQQTARKP